MGPASLVLLTLASTWGLDRVFIGHGWIWPVVLCGLAGHFITLGTRRWRVPQIVAVILALAGVALVGIWTVFGAQTHYGRPDHQTWTAVHNALEQVGQDFSGSVAPIPATPGFRLVAALGTGLVAILADWIVFRWGATLIGTAPGFALFVVCCSSGEGGGREAVIAVEIVALLLFLLSIRNGSRSGSKVWFAGVRSGMFWSGLRTAGLTGGLALLAVVLVTPAIKGEDGKGVLGWRSSFGTGPGGDRVVLDPLVNLQTDLIKLGTVQAFIVSSPVNSYWRLTSLDTFDGTTWSATGKYTGVGTHLTGVSKRPAGTVEITEEFQIQGLASDWLPLAFNPLSVNGVSDVSFDKTTDSLLASSETTDGLIYSVVSYEYLSTLNQVDLEDAAPLRDLSSLKPDLALPSSVSPSVYALARSLVAGKTTEYDKALAIQNYLRGPLFTYTTSPPADPPGTNALDDFLFSSRQGYCQQFAGAYAVLARAAGLPTRLAIGFSTGTSLGPDSYEVYDGNAHTWPEVYFGPKFGWLPFEPTKGFSDPLSSTIDGTTAGGGHVSTTTPTTTPTTVPGQSQTPDTKPARTRPTLPSVSATTVPATARAGRSSPAWLLIPAVPVLVLAWAVANLGTRRARRKLRHQRAAADGLPATILANWGDVQELLVWRGLPRRGSETYAEFARRVGAATALDGQGPESSLPNQVGRLAELAVAADFAPSISPAFAVEAASVAASIEGRLFAGASRAERLRWALLPRPGRTRLNPNLRTTV